MGRIVKKKVVVKPANKKKGNKSKNNFPFAKKKAKKKR